MTSMLVRKRNLNFGDDKGAGNFIEKSPAGGVVVGDDVNIILEIEMIKK